MVRPLSSTSVHLLSIERKVANVKLYTDLKAVVNGLIDQTLKRKEIGRLGTKRY